MSISSVTGNNWYISSALAGSDGSENEKSPLEIMVEEKKDSQSGSGQQAISPDRKQLQAYTNAGNALSRLRESGTAITRESVAAELQRKELEFQLVVSSSLKSLGIDENIEFKIAMDSSGNIIVNSSHPDKDRVQEFFDSTPSLADEFKNIESLRNLSKSMSGSPLSMVNLRRSIQLENLSSYFEGMEQAAQSYSPLILAYSKSSIRSLTGINISV